MWARTAGRMNEQGRRSGRPRRYGQGRLSRGGTHQNPGTPFPFRNLSCYCRQSLTSSISTKPAVCRARPPLVQQAGDTPQGQGQGHRQGGWQLVLPYPSRLARTVPGDRNCNCVDFKRQGRPCGWGGCEGCAPVQAELSRARYSAAVLTSTCIVLSSVLVVTAVGTSTAQEQSSWAGRRQGCRTGLCKAQPRQVSWSELAPSPSQRQRAMNHLAVTPALRSPASASTCTGEGPWKAGRLLPRPVSTATSSSRSAAAQEAPPAWSPAVAAAAGWGAGPAGGRCD